jgi:hypothetical protein
MCRPCGAQRAPGDVVAAARRAPMINSMVCAIEVRDRIAAAARLPSLR